MGSEILMTSSLRVRDRPWCRGQHAWGTELESREEMITDQNNPEKLN